MRLRGSYIPHRARFVDPQVEWCEAEHFSIPTAILNVGPQAVLQACSWRSHGMERSQHSEIFETCDTAIGSPTIASRTTNGKQVRAQFAHFFTFRDGKIAKFSNTPTPPFKQAWWSRLFPRFDSSAFLHAKLRLRLS